MLSNSKIGVGLGVIVVILLGAFIGFDGDGGDNNIDNGVRSCVVDNDCVKDACCHAGGCVNVENAGDCSGVACTMSCEPGTLDCGQGSCGCVDGNCVVDWAE